MITPGQRVRLEQFRTVLNAMQRVLADRTAMLIAEQVAADELCTEVEQLTAGDDHPDAQAWRRAAVATMRALRERGDDVQQEWIAAYAELPPMSWPAA